MEVMFHCFGASTSSGDALRMLVPNNFLGYSRKTLFTSELLNHADLNDPEGFQPAGPSSAISAWISFAPIWLFASFLDVLSKHYPERLQDVKAIVACSSSSAITKRFSSNSFDRQLVDCLVGAEDQLVATCAQLSIPCQILRPTLIYGKVGIYGDRNLSLLLKQLRQFPLFPLPKFSGLRQPIHARQLAAVAFQSANQLITQGFNSTLPLRIALGGDTTLTYMEMIRLLQQVQRSGDPACRCRLFTIPNRLFFFLAVPLLLASPKTFEAVLRIGANLSGFTPAHQLLGSEPQPFPVQPLA